MFALPAFRELLRRRDGGDGAGAGRCERGGGAGLGTEARRRIPVWAFPAVKSPASDK